MTGADAARQRRHESPDVGAAVLRMVRGLIRRAGEGDTEAIEQLARIDRVTSDALSLGLLAGQRSGYSLAQLAQPLGVSRPAVLKRLAIGERLLLDWCAGDLHATRHDAVDVSRLLAAVPAITHPDDA